MAPAFAGLLVGWQTVALRALGCGDVAAIEDFGGNGGEPVTPGPPIAPGIYFNSFAWTLSKSVDMGSKQTSTLKDSARHSNVLS